MKERVSLYTEAKKLYGEKDNLSLEEEMAEGFREYVMSQDGRSLGRRILDFFKELFAKVTNWKYMKPSLAYYYQRINAGSYTNSNIKVPSISESRYRIAEPTSLNGVKSGVSELFESNPELANIGNQQQYSQYLDTIFPDSKVKILFIMVLYLKINLKNLINKEGTNLREYGGIHFGDLAAVKDLPK